MTLPVITCIFAAISVAAAVSSWKASRRSKQYRTIAVSKAEQVRMREQVLRAHRARRT